MASILLNAVSYLPQRFASNDTAITHASTATHEEKWLLSGGAPMIDHSVDFLLKSSKERVRLSCNLRDDTARCMETSLRAIVRSRELLASSRALLSNSEYCEPEDRALIAPGQSATSSLQIVSKRDFDYEAVSVDGKHFCDCTFRNCTLLYSGSMVTFESCQFHDCRFQFSGAAGRTFQFLDCFDLLGDQTPNEPCSDSADSIVGFVN